MIVKLSAKADCGIFDSSWECIPTGSKVFILVLGIGVIAFFVLGFLALVSQGVQSAKLSTALSDPNSPESKKTAIDNYEALVSDKLTQLKLLETYETLFDELGDTSFVSDSDEQVIMQVTGATLVETKRLPSTFSGTSSGATIRLTKRVSVRSSNFGGQSRPGAEIPTIVDIGQFVITTKRAVFIGPKQTREFEYSKLLSVSIQRIGKDASILYLPVSNRKGVSGIGAAEPYLKQIKARLDVGISLKRGSKEQMIGKLKSEIDLLRKSPPLGYKPDF